MITKSSLWPELERVLTPMGILLYDLDLPEGQGGVLRLYISKDGGVGLEDCSLSAKAVERDDFLGAILEKFALEVSSPGVNRRLTRPEHYQSAIGERVKVTMKKIPSIKSNVFCGKLLGFENDCLQLEDEQSKQTQVLELKNISKARIDFLFD